MKIAVAGKGGVGKTTLAALLSRVFAEEGKRVIAVDADPDANLAQALGMSHGATPSISEMAELIEERTGAARGVMGGVFRLNPRVDDLVSLVGTTHEGVTLLVTGVSKGASSGCYCPEHVLLRRLLKHLVTERDEVVVVDMEAGIEHMTRGTAAAVDAFLIVVEPGMRSIQTALTVSELALQLGVATTSVVANKVRNEADLIRIRSGIGKLGIMGAISFDTSLVDADICGQAPHVRAPRALDEVRRIRDSLDRVVRARDGVAAGG